MITIKNIAEMAGTSRGTVDRVINKRGRVCPELEEKIMKIIEDNQFEPNMLGRALGATKEVHRIGIIINSVGNAFFDRVLDGINDFSKRYSHYGIAVVIREIRGYSEDEQLEAIEEISGQGIKALAITPLNTPKIIDRLNNLSIPIVTINVDAPIRRIAFVGCDYYNSGSLCGELARIALRPQDKIGIITGTYQLSGHSLRVEGFKTSAKTVDGVEIVCEIENQDDEDLSYKLTKKMLEENQIDLLFFGAGGTKGGMQAVIESKKALCIIAVDETDDVMKYLKQGIIYATVTQQPYKQGQQSMQILYQFLKNKKLPEHAINYTENQIKLRYSK